jgi:hypothetical protein
VKDTLQHLTNKNLSNKMYKYFGKINLKDYIKNFIKKIISDQEIQLNFQFYNLFFLKDYFQVNQKD